jgi:hypothetical protein
MPMAFGSHELTATIANRSLRKRIFPWVELLQIKHHIQVMAQHCKHITLGIDGNWNAVTQLRQQLIMGVFQDVKIEVLYP